MPLFSQLDLTRADEVIGTLQAGAGANLRSSCRDRSVDRVRPPGRLIATGDIHDNPLHLARVVAAAGLGGLGGTAAEGVEPAHLTLHEVIHPDRLVNGMDFSFRALTRIAALKAAHPEHVHTLLANHELAQVLGSGIVKDGVRVVEAFNEGVAYAFGDDAGAVLEAVKEFIRSMPLALLCEPENGSGKQRLLCAHSLPGPELMDRFDATVLEREMTDGDFTPRQGSAHLMIWGRGHTPEQLRLLAGRWGVDLFILGHEKADTGVMVVPPNAIVLNSDHERGVYLPIDLANPPGPDEAAGVAVSLAGD